MFEHITDDCNCPGKWCSNCGQVKCRGAFSRNRSAKDGLDNYCRICKSEWLKAYRQGNLDQVRERRERVKSSETYRHKGVVPLFDHVDDNCDCPGKRCPGCEQIKCHGTFKSYRGKESGLQTYCRACGQARNRSERKREYHKIWRRDNTEYLRKYEREARSEYKRTYREQNADKLREQARAYDRSHSEERAHNEKIRRTRKMQAEGSFTLVEWNRLCNYYDYTCLRCGRQEPDIKLTVDHVIPLSKGGSNDISNIQPLCHSCNSGKHTKNIDYRVEWESRN